MLASTPSVSAIDVCKLLWNVVSYASVLKAVISEGEVRVSWKLLLTTLDSIVSPLLPVAVACSCVTALFESTTGVTAGGLAQTAVSSCEATSVAKVPVPVAAWFNVV